MCNTNNQLWEKTNATIDGDTKSYNSQKFYQISKEKFHDVDDSDDDRDDQSDNHGDGDSNETN